MTILIVIAFLFGTLCVLIAGSTQSFAVAWILERTGLMAYGMAFGLLIGQMTVQSVKDQARRYWHQQVLYRRASLVFKFQYDNIVAAIVDLTGYTPAWVEENPISVLREMFGWFRQELAILRTINLLQAERITELLNANVALIQKLRHSEDARLESAVQAREVEQAHAAEVKALQAANRRLQVQFDELAKQTLASQQAQIDAAKHGAAHTAK